ncbi:hypothetical protein EKO27_g8325 [Xylaria grammica]|uniref:Helicase C-terminal domain-containing protein n=1 Tax=Xylaria grammica TaxID=363999 RepID=A0A439CXK3_9PEZI|nr:hypothetical protein EKO27_g8325 [Xylaria grammica]
MDYSNHRPTKRARFEDGSHCELRESGYLDGQPYIEQTEFSQTATFNGHTHHQLQVSFPVAPPREQSIAAFDTVLLTDTPSQWQMSATHFMDNSTQSPEGIPNKWSVSRQVWYRQLDQSFAELGTPNLPLQPRQDFTSNISLEQLSQQIIPLSGHAPINSTGTYQDNLIELPAPVHTLSYSDATGNTAAEFVHNPNQLLQPVLTSKTEDETVCFGMVENLCATCDVKSLVVPSEVSIRFHSSEQFQSIDDELISGQVRSNHTSMIHGLLEEDTLQLFFSCVINKNPSTSNPRRSLKILPCSVEVTIYGPLELLQEVGDWFQEQDIYLQDPRLCHLDVKYCNPQKLSTGEIETCPLVSEVIAKRKLSFEMQVIQSQIGFLDTLKSRDDLYEAQQPTAIRSILKRHQKQALTFMTQRENGWNFDQKYIDIWEARHTDHGTYFINKVSNTYLTEEPPQFCGGIIADTMGLGKTLTMIALVASDLDSPRGERMATFDRLPGAPEVETSLIIIPPPLLDTWEEQLSEHVFENRLKWRRHHAKNKIAGLDELRAQHIVLTTYHTVSAEWKGAKDGNNSFLFSFHWKRIILDEASLLKFIRATPYDDMKQFEAAISSLWKSGEDEEAVKRLQYLSACLLLRRSKEAIDLPPKQDLLFPVDFLPDERVAYENLREQAIYSIDEAVYGHNGSLRHNNHANALRKIEALRLFSDLGLQYHARHEPQADQDWPKIAQQAFNSRRAIEPLVCMHCSLSLDFAESLLDEPTTAAPEPQFSSCGDAFEEIHDSLSLPISPTRLSSKVEALITDLRSLPPNTKCVVFSTWRLTLDLVEAGLDQNSIQHIRFDGKVPQNERGAVVSRFRNDPEIRIMLLTLSCGAVGLTLTVASRAYLMEPHWNPTLEEQALARIHRLGQKQPVTTVRLYMRNSFEEEVIKVQESKKQLANVLLQPHDGGSAGDNLSTLQGLRSLL